MAFWAAAAPYAIPAAIAAGSAISAAGSYLSGSAAAKSSAHDRALQREMATMGIQYRTQDAKAAGIHPLAALGANISSPSPTAVGVSPKGSALSKMGQGVANTALSIQQKRLTDAQINKLNAETAAITRMGQQAPSTIIPKTNAVGVVTNMVPKGFGHKYQQNEVPMSSSPGISSGAVPLETGFITKEGYYKMLPSQAASESLEGSPLDQATYGLGKIYKIVRDGLFYGFSTNSKYVHNIVRSRRPPFDYPGYHLEYHAINGGWKVVPDYRGRRLYYKGPTSFKW